MSDYGSDNDDDYGYISEDDDNINSITDALKTENIETIEKYLKENNNIQYVNDESNDNSLNLAIKTGNMDIIRMILKGKVIPNSKTFDLAILKMFEEDLGDIRILQEIEKLYRKNNMVYEFSSKSLENVINMKINIFHDIMKLYSDKLLILKNINQILNILDLVLIRKKYSILDKILSFNPEITDNTLLEAIESESIETTLKIFNYKDKIKGGNYYLTNNELLKFVKVFGNESENLLKKHNIKYNIIINKTFPKWASYCTYKLGINELRKILIDVGITSINNKNVNDMNIDEICSVLNNQYEIFKITFNNNIYECENKTSSKINSDDQFLVIKDRNRKYCLINEDINSRYSNNVYINTNPITRNELSDKDFNNIKKIVEFNQGSNNKFNEIFNVDNNAIRKLNSVQFDDDERTKIQRLFNVLHDFNNNINIEDVNKYINMNGNDFYDFKTSISANLQLDVDVLQFDKVTLLDFFINFNDQNTIQTFSNLIKVLLLNV